MNDLIQILSKATKSNVRAKEFLNESIFWLQHIDTLEKNYNNSKDILKKPFLLNDITMNFCVLINWLAIVDKRKLHLSNSEVMEFLHQRFYWPRYVAENFINNVRNPSIHLGRSYKWRSYDKVKWKHSIAEHGSDKVFKGAFDPNVSEVLWDPRMKGLKDKAYTDGYIEHNLFSYESGELQGISITFFYIGFRKKIDNCIGEIFKKICTMQEAELRALHELSYQVALFQIPAPENITL